MNVNNFQCYHRCKHTKHHVMLISLEMMRLTEITLSMIDDVEFERN